MSLTVGSLFSGIGGLDLGLERAGMRVIWQSEIDPYACKVLRKHWPEVVNHGNIKEIDWSVVERPDVICGGYPCQPFSTAGKRNGTNDPRHLFPWVLEAISRLRPRYAILENVRGHLSMGGTTVLGDLASIGYDAEWRIISAASVGALHRRDRLFIVAYPNSCHAPNGRQCEALQSKNTSGRNDGRRSRSHFGEVGLGSSRKIASIMADTHDTGSRTPERAANADRSAIEQERQIFSQSWLGRCSTNVRKNAEYWQTEPDVGRVADGVSHRVDKLRGLGNAVVPQVAEFVGRLVIAHAA